MKCITSALLALCILAGLAGCAKQEAEQSPVDTPDPAPVVEAAPTPAEPPEETLTVYRCGDLEIPVPAEYVPLLSIDTELEPLSEHRQPLFSVSEQASLDAFALDHPGEDWGMGWMCSITLLDRVGFESWVCEENNGSRIFATGGDGQYYLASYPSDVRLYRPGDAAASGEVPEDVEGWSILNEWANSLPEQIIEQNGLTAYDARDLLESDYTYDGRHIELAYRVTNDVMDTVLLALSQPARQGEGGIWCVERIRFVYSDYSWTDSHLVFPAALGIDEPASDYYARLQERCDAGESPELLTAQGAALDYAKNESVAWLFGEDVSETDFETVESLG